MEVRIPWDKFCTDALEFLKTSNALNDGWESKGDFCETGRAYLSKTVRRRIEISPEASCPDLEDTTSSPEPECDTKQPNSQLVTFEYHITYSLSYEVPILFFNVWRPNGTLLDIEQIWNLASGAYKEAVRESKWSAVSQQDHPLLGTPYFYFHPCNSAKVLGDLNKSANSVLSWLSVVGPILGLDVPIDYLKIAT